MTKNRLLIWIVAILLVTNITTVVSVMINSRRVSAGIQNNGAETANAKVLFFNEHLQLTESQMADFMQVSRKFGQTAGPMTAELDILRRNMIIELARTSPDMGKVEKITEDIGVLHTKMKMATTTYYLGLKSICTPDQQERLKEMFMVMSDPAGDLDALRRGGPMGPGPGRGRNRNMQGMGRGPGWGRL